MYGVLPQDSKENQRQMVSAKRDHWQTCTDERSGEPVGGLVRIKPRRLLLDVGKPRQSIGRVNSGRTVKLDGVGTFYYTANTSGQGVDTEEEVSAKQIVGTRVRFIPEVARSVGGQVSTRSLVSENTFWEELKLDSSASSSGGNDDEDVTENPLG